MGPHKVQDISHFEETMSLPQGLLLKFDKSFKVKKVNTHTPTHACTHARAHAHTHTLLPMFYEDIKRV